MSEGPLITVGKPRDRELWIPCERCNALTRHRELARCTSREEFAEAVEFWEDLSIVQCQGCGTASFCVESWNTQDRIVNATTGQEELKVRTQVYPPSLPGRRLVEYLECLPRRVRDIYLETHRAIVHELVVLGAVGVRALVEAVCNDKQIRGNDLQEKIDNLLVAGHITAAGAWILHGIRHIGNGAAHEIKSHTIQELTSALEVVEHLLKGVYLLRAHAALFPWETLNYMHRVPSDP